MSFLEPEKVTRDMIGQDYNGIKVRIKEICQISDVDEYLFNYFKEFDSGGNLPFKFYKFEDEIYNPKSSFYQFFGGKSDDYIVCVEEIESGEKNIYPYGDHGVTVSAWKGSDKLTNLNDKTGIFEHLKSFKMFEAKEDKITKFAEEFERNGFEFKIKSKFNDLHYAFELNGFDMQVFFDDKSDKPHSIVFITMGKALTFDDDSDELDFIQKDMMYKSVDQLIKAFKKHLPLYSSKKLSDLGKTGLWDK